MKKNIIKFVCFSIILGSIVTLLALFVFVPINITNAYSSFYMEAENSLDITLIGNSTVMYDYVPALAYHTSGITSHAIGSQPSHPEVIKIAIEEVYRTQSVSNKLVLVDLTGLTYQTHEQQEFFVKNYYDAMPEGEFKNELAKRYSYLQNNDNHDFELFENHNNFRNYEIFLEMSGEQKKLKGHKPMGGIADIEPVSIDPNKTEPLPKDGEEYLYEILEVAKKYPSMDFLFIRMPRFVSKDNVSDCYVLRSCKKAVEEAGYHYVDFCDYVDEIGLDPKKHQRDAEHLNTEGAIIFTPWLANYLKTNYGVTPIEKTAAVTADFEDCYQYYKDKYIKE